MIDEFKRARSHWTIVTAERNLERRSGTGNTPHDVVLPFFDPVYVRIFEWNTTSPERFSTRWIKMISESHMHIIVSRSKSTNVLLI